MQILILIYCGLQFFLLVFETCVNLKKQKQFSIIYRSLCFDADVEYNFQQYYLSEQFRKKIIREIQVAKSIVIMENIYYLRRKQSNIKR